MDLSVVAQGPSVAERARMLDQMRQVSDRFYAAAIAIQNHAFIEFNGLMRAGLG